MDRVRILQEVDDISGDAPQMENMVNAVSNTLHFHVFPRPGKGRERNS